MAGLRDHVFDRERPTFLRLVWGWNFSEESGLFRDPRLTAGYALFWTSTSGETAWVRRDMVRDPQVLDEVRAAAQRTTVAAAALSHGASGPSWPCAPVLRPTLPGARPLLTAPPG